MDPGAATLSQASDETTQLAATSTDEKQVQHAVALAIPLPADWPRPLLPQGTLLDVGLPLADTKLLIAALEDAAGSSSKSSLRKKRKERARDAGGTHSPEGAGTHSPEGAESLAKVGCRCGVLDETKFMVACDGCDQWFHGECVGLRETQLCRSRQWFCRNCRRERKAAERSRARDSRYCVCRGGWDGHSFMLMCDVCSTWYHGKCVGLGLDSPEAATELAFRRYVCPCCSRATLAASTAKAASPISNGGADAGSSIVGAAAESSLLSMLSDDCILHIFSHLSLPILVVSLSSVSHKLAALCEVRFEQACSAQGWRPPRRARGSGFEWRRLLQTRGCAICLNVDAPFPVRSRHQNIAFRLCGGCARLDKVQQQASLHQLEVDTIDTRGKALYARQFHTPLFGHANGFSENELKAKVSSKGL